MTPGPARTTPRPGRMTMGPEGRPVHDQWLEDPVYHLYSVPTGGGAFSGGTEGRTRLLFLSFRIASAGLKAQHT